MEKSAPIVTVPPKMRNNIRQPRVEFMMLSILARFPPV
jgi:hypothetical protein